MIGALEEVPAERREAVLAAADMLKAARLAPDDDGADLDRLTSIPVGCRKPKKLEYFRVRPGPEWTAAYYLYREQDGDGMPGEYYVVAPNIASHLAGQARAHDLRLAVNKSGAVFLFPIPRGEGIRDAYRASLLRATTDAEEHWVRIQWDGPSGGYHHYQAEGDLGDPVWMDTAVPTVDAAIEAAFSGRIVADEDHPVIRRARGLE